MARVEAQTRSSVAGLRFVGLLAALTASPAYAGAWIAPEGGQEIVTTVAGERDDAPFYESSAYWELPAGERTSFIAAPWVEQNSDTVEGWRAEATLSAKRAVLRMGDTVMAVQAGAVWVSHPEAGCGEGGAEVRWLSGRPVGDGGAFLNLELAGRGFDGGCQSVRGEFAAGYRPSPDWLAMGQVFVDATPEFDQAVKAQLTLVRFRESGRGIQVGVRARIDGGAEEAALVFGLWGRPGN